MIPSMTTTVPTAYTAISIAVARQLEWPDMPVCLIFTLRDGSTQLVVLSPDQLQSLAHTLVDFALADAR